MSKQQMCKLQTYMSAIIRKSAKSITLGGILVLLSALSIIAFPQQAHAYSMSNNYFNIETGTYGQITSLKITNDLFPTNYVMNTSNASAQNTTGHQWFGELMFKYKLGTASTWSTATTNKSADARTMSQSGNVVTVTYQNSTNASGIKNFKVVENYSLVNDYFLWSITVTNTSTQTLTIGDFGLPLAFNEFWTAGDAIYETRAVDHSFTGNNSSYLYVTRPSGLGQFLLMVPDASTGAGFEYQDHWRTSERASEEAAWCQDQSGWQNGLNVFYIHSDVIKSTNRGYLPNTSLVLAAGESKTYSFKFFSVASESAMKQKLYDEGLIDVNVVPGMMFSTNMTAKVDLHTSKTIDSITLPTGATMTYKNTVATNHKIYELTLTQLGQNNITINYDSGKKTVLQFYAIEPIATAIQSRATHMVNYEQWSTSDFKNKVFDDWMLNTQAKRNSFAGYWGWGDDWGLTHGEFLAEKNALTPVATEVNAVDDYLETAIWNSLMKQHHSDYYVHDFLMYSPGDVSGECKNTLCGNNTPMGRGYAYPHIYNTYFSMYKIQKQYPNLITYNGTANTYLYRAYRIMKNLYDGSVAYNWNTGLMGELTTPEIIQALKDEGYTAEATDLTNKMATKYNNFKNTTYPYGSEYSYDNTGEEAVYMLAKTNNNTSMMGKINSKTRACRGNQPVWYYYADPVTNCGENWWNFQYTASLAGYCMDDWMRYYSTTPELDARMTYAAKIANIGCINSGQISSATANIGAAAWTYQAEKGNLGSQGVGNGTLQNGWRDMTGEADLGLFGALKILSSDVAVDPIFGLYGYGCDVTQSGTNYAITPKDGVFKRLNLITQKLYIELNRDIYTSATVATTKNYVELNLQNQYTIAAHTTKLSVYGLAAGSYDVYLAGTKVSTFTATNNTKSVVSLNLGTASTYNVKIQAGNGTPVNTAPVVDAGNNATFALASNVTLTGTATDDGLPTGSTLTYTWSKVSGTGTVTFANASLLNTTATVSTAGTYVFMLTASDGALSTSDTVTMTVIEASADGCITNLAFNETSGTTAADSSGYGINGTINGGATFATGKNANAISLSGSSQYVSLPTGVASSLNNFTIATWVKLNSITDWSRIFDFGTGTTNYMFLTASAGGSGLRYAITTSGNGSEQQITYSSGLTTGTWKHIVITLSGSTGIMYVDGVQVATNTNMTIAPSALGSTTLNYIGKSQWSGDSYLNGLVDDFKIYNRALSATEVSTLFGGTLANTAPVVNAGADGTFTLPATATLSGTVTDDGLPSNTLSYTWSKVSGPGTVTFANANAVNTTATVSAAGTYVFNLTVSDGALSASDTVTMVANAADATTNIAPNGTASTSFCSSWETLTAINDGFTPSSSADTSNGQYGNWDNPGTTQWVQYDFSQNYTISKCDVYWFSDIVNSGDIDVPTSCAIKYWDGSSWIAVSNASGLGVLANQFNTTTFTAVSTNKIRLEMTAKTDNSTGILEWRVWGQ